MGKPPVAAPPPAVLAQVSYAQILRLAGHVAKWIGAAIALASFVFAIVQYYYEGVDKRRERAIAQALRHEQFLSSSQASTIAQQSAARDGKSYDLAKFADHSTDQFRALVYYFNLVEGISYLYNKGAIDPEYTEDNLLCPIVKAYRMFILAESGNHGDVIGKINGAGVFPKGHFEQTDQIFAQWHPRRFGGQDVDHRCALVWKQ